MRQFYYLCLYNPIAANMTHMITYPSGRCTEGALCARRGDTPPHINHLFTARCAKTLPNPSLYGGALRHRGKTIIKHCPSLRGTSEERLCPNEAEGSLTWVLGISCRKRRNSCVVGFCLTRIARISRIGALLRSRCRLCRVLASRRHTQENRCVYPCNP